MKHNSFIFLFLLTIQLSVHSQVINAYGILGGINSAYQTSYLDDIFYGSSQSRIGYNIGIFASFINSDYFNLLVEPRVTQKGFSTSLESYGNKRPSLTYFSVSLLAKPKVDFKFATTYLLLGSSMNWLVKKNEDGLNGIFEDIAQNTISLNAGVGVQKRIFKRNFVSFECKYDYEIQTSPIHGFKHGGNFYFFEYGQTFRNKTFEFILVLGFL